MNETDRALLELRLLKAGTPYHIHHNGLICVSPYCHSLFEEESRPGPDETQEHADKHYAVGSNA